jgi:hypothetical protein
MVISFGKIAEFLFYQSAGIDFVLKSFIADFERSVASTELVFEGNRNSWLANKKKIRNSRQ